MKLALLLFLSASPSFADWSLQMGQEVRYYTESETLSTQYPRSLRAGYLISGLGFFLEYTKAQEPSTGNETLWVRASQSTLMLWARYSFLEGWGPFAGLGAGFGQKASRSGFYGSTREDYGVQESIAALEAGWWAPVFKPLTAEVFFGGVFGFAPQWTGGVRLGAVF